MSNEISGILKTSDGDTKVTYTIVETDKHILRVAGQYDPNTKSQEWFDLRPMSNDPRICTSIITTIEDKLNIQIPKPEKTLTHWHNSGMVAAYGIFQFENSRFLVTDAFGGQTFHEFLVHLKPEDRPTLGTKDIISFLRSLTKTLLLWKKSHEYISSQTVLVSYNHEILHAGLICFPDKFSRETLNEFEIVLRPPIYNRKLTNQKSMPDDQYAIALITLQLLSWDVGINEPMSSFEMLEKFRNLIQDKNMARLYQSKLRPTIQQLFEGAITIEKLEQICQDLEADLDQAKRLAENVARYATFSQDSLPQMLRGSFYFSFTCPYCNTSFPGLNAEYSEFCPICHKKSDLPLAIRTKVCRICKNEFDKETSVCPNCQGIESTETTAPKTETVTLDPLKIGTMEGSEEMRLNILPLEELDLEESKDKSKSSDKERTKEGSKSSGRIKPVIPRSLPTQDKLASSMQNLLNQIANINCRYQDGDVTVNIEIADAGEWKFQVTRDSEGQKILEQIEYSHKIKSDLSQTISLDFEAIEEASCVFVLIYFNKQLIDRKKVMLEG